MEAKVLVVSSVTAGKEYCLPFLCGVLGTLGGADVLTIDDGTGQFSAELVLPPLEGDLPYYARAARMREAARQHFLAGDWSHLYFHDADMLPPADIIQRLLDLDAPVASGLYIMRGMTDPVVPAVLSFEAGPAGILCTNIGAIQSETNVWPVLSMGMGCMLIRRDVMEVTSFRSPDDLAALHWSEDYAWCSDATEKGFGPVQVDLTASCWHVNNDGRANRLHVGPIGPAVTWIDMSHAVTNKFGQWFRGQPRFDLTAEQAAELGPGFDKRDCRQTTVEWKKVEELV